MQLEAPLPEELESFLKRLESESALLYPRSVQMT